MSYQYLEFSVENRIATIILNRPNEGNTFNIDIANELEAVARLCAMNSDVRAVIISARGKLFSGGGDLEYMLSNIDTLDVAIKALADRLHSAYSTFVRMEAPLIVAANGTAAGIGLSLALLGDLTIATPSAKFVASYTQVGLSPDGGLTHTLPRLIGEKRPKELILTNRVLSADEALEWGMINRIVSEDQLMSTALNLAESFAKGPSGAIADAKRLLIASRHESLEAQMHLEGLALASNAASENGKEGITAFYKKKAPKFT